jgi:hypothetical protein
MRVGVRENGFQKGNKIPFLRATTKAGIQLQIGSNKVFRKR